jgi:hypothetical protein
MQRIAYTSATLESDSIVTLFGLAEREGDMEPEPEHEEESDNSDKIKVQGTCTVHTYIPGGGQIQQTINKRERERVREQSARPYMYVLYSSLGTPSPVGKGAPWYM